MLCTLMLFYGMLCLSCYPNGIVSHSVLSSTMSRSAMPMVGFCIATKMQLAVVRIRIHLLHNGWIFYCQWKSKIYFKLKGWYVFSWPTQLLQTFAIRTKLNVIFIMQTSYILFAAFCPNPRYLSRQLLDVPQIFSYIATIMVMNSVSRSNIMCGL